jgi:hypothetical protein
MKRSGSRSNQALADKGVPTTLVPAVAVVPATARPADAAIKRIAPERRHPPEARDDEAVSAERYPKPALVYQVG